MFATGYLGKITWKFHRNEFNGMNDRSIALHLIDVTCLVLIELHVHVMNMIQITASIVLLIKTGC